MSGAIPITVLTGYLGSGKTTLLKRLLARPELRDTLVLVNEFGEIALDHELLQTGTESIALLGRGCICCALRSDLAEQLDDLYTRRLRGELPAFARVVIETTGLADPAPILQTLVAEPMLAALYRLDAIVTTADAELGARELDRHLESVKQVAIADRLVVTKVDRVDDSSLGAFEARLRALNPAAPIARSREGDLDADFVFGAGLDGGARDPQRLAHWLPAERFLPLPPAGALVASAGTHDNRVRTYSLQLEEPVSGQALWRGLERLVERHGERLLRVKGIVALRGQSQPRVVHIVQHVLYPVATLPAWSSDDKRTRLVFIVLDLERDEVIEPIQRSLAAEPQARG